MDALCIINDVSNFHELYEDLRMRKSKNYLMVQSYSREFRCEMTAFSPVDQNENHVGDLEFIWEILRVGHPVPVVEYFCALFEIHEFIHVFP